MNLSKITSNNIFKNYFFPFKKQLIYVATALFFTSLLILLLGKAIEYLVNKGFNANNIILLNNSIIAILLIIIGIAIASFIRISTLNSICEKAVSSLRLDIYKKLINLPANYYEQTKISDISTRLLNDATLVTELISTNFPFILRYILTAIGGMILLFLTNLKLASFVTILVPVIVVPVIIIAKKVKNYSEHNQRSLASIASHIDETLTNVKTVQLYQRENYEEERFQNIISSNLNNALLRIKFKSLLISTIILLIFSGISFILWLGCKEVFSGSIKAGELSSFIYYAIIVASSIAGLGEVSTDIVRLQASINRLEEILFSNDIQVFHLDTKFLNSTIESIEFKNLSFSYPLRPNIKILDDINFKIHKGEKVAIIGPSASGKTTIFQLLLKFYNTTEGHIKINDDNLENLNIDNIRNIFGFVTQEPVIFSTSIYDNIKYGNLDATDYEIEEAAKAAEIYDFFESLPKGLHTQVGENAVALSGGEKQRIAIARAFLKNSQILLLDEPTSNLDKNTEEFLQKAFINLMQDRTSIIITHNPSILKWIDKIIVINSGKLEAIGSYSELLENSIFFKKFIENVNISDISTNFKTNTLFFN